MKGKDVRALILNSGFPLWKVAERFGCSPQWFSVKLRHDFTKEEVEQVRQIVKELQAE